MSHIYLVTHNNGKFSRPPLAIAASKPSMAAKKFLDGQGSNANLALTPVKLRKGEFITVSIERIG